MIFLNREPIETKYFPDNTLLLKQDYKLSSACISWYFENNEELVTLIFLTKHLRNKGVKLINLQLPYIPNARQDRVKTDEDVFTLKYFAEIINSLGFDKVYVRDPHSSVSTALIDRVAIEDIFYFIKTTLKKIEPISEKEKNITIFFPDEGAMKRYSEYTKMLSNQYFFGIKERDWETGTIKDLKVIGDINSIKDKKILIIDDICSYGGTFYHSAKKLKELGAKNIYLYVTHCENNILKGDLYKSGLVDKVFTTDSIFTERDDFVEVLN